MTQSGPQSRERPASPRGPGRPGYDQEAVLRAAIDVFNRRGYDATSIGDLARHLGLTKSAIYHHVPSKEHLLRQALDEALDGLTSAVETARADHRSGTAGERLRATLYQAVLILTRNLPAVTLLLRVRGNTALEADALRRRRDIDNVLADLVTEAIAEGAIRDDLDPQVVSRLLFGTVNSLTEWYRHDGPVAPAELAETLTTLLFDGLKQETRKL